MAAPGQALRRIVERIPVGTKRAIRPVASADVNDAEGYKAYIEKNTKPSGNMEDAS
jgi:hypothetical protein